MTRFISKNFGICGEEDIGIEIVTDPESPYVGRRPIPPILDAQLDLKWMDLMRQKKRVVLTDLQGKIFKHRLEHWLETFLCLFILLSNLEFSYQHQCHKLRRASAVVCFQSTYYLMSSELLSRQLRHHSRQSHSQCSRCWIAGNVLPAK